MLLLAGLPGLAHPGQAQTMEIEVVAVRGPEGLGSLSELPRLRSCGRVEERVGSLRGSGTVAYRLDEAGRPDTTTLEVVTTTRLSTPGLRSAAARLLGDCRFDPARQAGDPVAVLVEQRIAFTTRTLLAEPPLRPRLAGEPPAAGAGSALEAVQAEELPGIIACSRLPTRERGDLQVSYVIGTDGRAEPGTAEVRASSNRFIAQYAERFARACRFTPGRLFGERVRVRVEQHFRVR